MKHSKYLRSLANAAGTVAYIVVVALFFANAEAMFGNVKSFLIPVFMLLLLVISASVTGLLVLGRPIVLYLNGEKREAFAMLFATLGWLVLFLAVVGAVLIVIK